MITAEKVAGREIQALMPEGCFDSCFAVGFASRPVLSRGKTGVRRCRFSIVGASQHQ